MPGGWIILKLYKRISEVTDLVMFFCLSITISFLPYVIYPNEYSFELLWIVPCILFFSYLCNLYIKHLVLFAVLHIVALIGLLSISLPLYCIIISTLIMIVMTLTDFNFWFFDKERNTISIPISFLIVFICIYLYIKGKGNSEYVSAIYYLGLIFIIAAILRIYLDNTVKISAGESGNGYAPLLAIRKRNNRFVMRVLALILGVSCLSQVSLLEKGGNLLASTIGDALLWVMRFLFNCSGNPNEIQNIEKLEPERNLVQLPKSSDTNWFFVILEYIILIVVVCFTLWLFVKLIKKVIQILQEYLLKKKNPVQQVYDEFAPIEVSEKIHSQKERRFVSSVSRNDIRERIRRKYQQIIHSYIRHGYQVNEAHTPLERNDDILHQKSVDHSLLTDYYNKARYSDKSFTTDDWNLIKKHLGK